MKKLKPAKEWHSANTKFGMGDYYGTGIKNPMGRMRESSMGFNSVSREGLNKPPKSLA